VASESALSNWYHIPPDMAAVPTTEDNVYAACVNTFYIVNTIHHLSYRYGFTEVHIWLFDHRIEI
jgi:hypothetical protein